MRQIQTEEDGLKVNEMDRTRQENNLQSSSKDFLCEMELLHSKSTVRKPDTQKKQIFFKSPKFIAFLLLQVFYCN